MKTIVSGYTKGILYALTFSVGLIFLFAFAVQYVGLSNTAVGIITQIIKAISIFIGVFFVAKSVAKRAWLHGACLGLLYTALAFLILGIIDGGFSVTEGFLAEAIFASVVGLLSAILFRLKKTA